jgi:hypothetical protein
MPGAPMFYVSICNEVGEGCLVVRRKRLNGAPIELLLTLSLKPSWLLTLPCQNQHGAYPPLSQGSGKSTTLQYEGVAYSGGVPKVCSKSRNWKDMVQDDNRCVCGILFLDNLHTASLSISMRILVLNMSIMLRTCRILVYHFNSTHEFLATKDCRGL